MVALARVPSRGDVNRKDHDRYPCSVTRKDDHRATKQYTPYSQTASSAPQGGQYERKCMTLPCGSTWCYNTRR